MSTLFFHSFGFKKPLVVFTVGFKNQQAAQKIMQAKFAFACLYVNGGQNAARQLRFYFAHGYPILALCSSGIVWRILAPILKDKHTEGPVLIANNALTQWAVLLGAHERGGNYLGHYLANFFKGELLISTQQTYLKQIQIVGLGCIKHVSLADVYALLNFVGVDLLRLNAIASIDLKSKESAFLELSKKHAIPFETFSPSAINCHEKKIQTPSDYVRKTVGVSSVCEGASLAAMAAYKVRNPFFLKTKIVYPNVTLAWMIGYV